MPNEVTKSKKHLFWTLFRSTFVLSAFTIGGGYVIIPLLKKKFVEQLGWIEEDEMLDLIAIAQSSPGPIAVNASILIGYKLSGVPGAILTMLGTILPPMISLTIISYIYMVIKDNIIVKALFAGMSVGSAVVVVDAVLTLAFTILKKKQAFPIILMVVAFIATLLLHIHILIIILCCALLGIFSVLIQERRVKRREQ